MIGYLSNTVAIPVDVGAAGSFGALVTQVRDHVLEAITCQRVPFERVVEALAPPRSRAMTPLVQVVFAMQPRAVPIPALDGLSVAVLPRHNEAARYELILNLETTPDGALEGPLTYATALFDRATVAGWVDHWLTILRDAPQEWDAPLDRSFIETTANKAADAPGEVSAGFATDTERALAAVWGEFLQTAPTSRDDDFFVLGGHSLLLMRVVNRVNSLGLGRIELAEALGATSLSGMAALIDGKPASGPAQGREEARPPAALRQTWPTDEATRPGDAAGESAVLPEEELRLVADTFNATAADYPRDSVDGGSLAGRCRATRRPHRGDELGRRVDDIRSARPPCRSHRRRPARGLSGRTDRGALCRTRGRRHRCDPRRVEGGGGVSAARRQAAARGDRPVAGRLRRAAVPGRCQGRRTAERRPGNEPAAPRRVAGRLGRMCRSGRSATAATRLM